MFQETASIWMREASLVHCRQPGNLVPQVVQLGPPGSPLAHHLDLLNVGREPASDKEALPGVRAHARSHGGRLRTPEERFWQRRHTIPAFAHEHVEMEWGLQEELTGGTPSPRPRQP